MKFLAPTSEKLFFSGASAKDVRLGDLFFRLDSKDLKSFTEKVSPENINGEATLMVSLDDNKADESEGALDAVKELRRKLFQYCPPYFSEQKASVVDCGHVFNCETKNSDSTREMFFAGLNFNHQWLTFGQSWSHHFIEMAAFDHYLKSKAWDLRRPLVIQFSSRLSMREHERGDKKTTGKTLNRDCGQFDSFDLLVVGPHVANFSKEHAEDFCSESRRFIDLEKILDSKGSLFDLLLHETQDWMIAHRPIWIAVDFSVLSLSAYTNASKPYFFGIPVEKTHQLLKTLWTRNHVLGLSLYAKSMKTPVVQSLAAEWAYRFLYRI